MPLRATIANVVVSAAVIAGTIGHVQPGRADAGTVVVGTREELLAALAGATAGDTVFVAGGASIDLTGHKRIGIPAGVTQALSQLAAQDRVLVSQDQELGVSAGLTAKQRSGNREQVLGHAVEQRDDHVRIVSTKQQAR